MLGPALTALEPLVFPRISTEIGLVLAPAVDGMLSQPVATSTSSPSLHSTADTRTLLIQYVDTGSYRYVL